MFANQDFEDLLESLLGSETDRYKESIIGDSRDCFRFNPLKFDPGFQQSLLAREGFHPEPWNDFPNIWIVPENSVPEGKALGKSLSHFLGNIYIQNPASMMPPLVLDPRPGERVLDLCAAPGSKTSLMAAMMKGKGLLVANDRSKKRLQSLVFNLRRCGVPNILFFNHFGEHFGNLYYERFDRILVDPPCSALGTLGKNPEVLTWWEPRRSESLARVQLSLLISGLKALKLGGRLVYSTCTITPEENESVLDQVLRKFGSALEVEEITMPGLASRPALESFGKVRFHPGVGRAIRLYPFESGSEGFFIASIRKVARCHSPRLNRPVEVYPDQLDSAASPRVSRILDSLTSKFGLDSELFQKKAYRFGKELFWVNDDAFSLPCFLPLVSAGYPLAHAGSASIKLTTEAVNSIGHEIRNRRFELQDPIELEDFVNRRDLETAEPDCDQVAVFFEGRPVGHGMIRQGRLLSRFPRAGWNFSLS